MAKGPNAVMLVLGEGPGQRTLWLEYNIDALCQLEELLDEDAAEIVRRMVKSSRLAYMRAMFWAGLREHHAAFDLKAAGELLRLPGKDQVRERILDAFNKAFPAPKKAAAESDGGNGGVDDGGAGEADRPPGDRAAGTSSSEPGSD